MSVVVVGCVWLGVGCRMCFLCCKKFARASVNSTCGHFDEHSEHDLLRLVRGIRLNMFKRIRNVTPTNRNSLNIFGLYKHCLNKKLFKPFNPTFRVLAENGWFILNLVFCGFSSIIALPLVAEVVLKDYAEELLAAVLIEGYCMGVSESGVCPKMSISLGNMMITPGT